MYVYRTKPTIANRPRLSPGTYPSEKLLESAVDMLRFVGQTNVTDEQFAEFTKLQQSMAKQLTRAYSQSPSKPLEEWLIWSIEHSAYWLPDSDNYTPDPDLAGRYTMDDALAACTQAMQSPYFRKHGVPPVVMAPGPEYSDEYDPNKLLSRRDDL